MIKMNITFCFFSKERSSERRSKLDSYILSRDVLRRCQKKFKLNSESHSTHSEYKSAKQSSLSFLRDSTSEYYPS